MTVDQFPGATPSPEQARAELVATLNAIEDKLNVPKQVHRAKRRAVVQIATVKVERPAVFYAGVAGLAGAAGLAVWGIVRAIAR
ncbi:DUF3618 domain-containing protein [Plantibacter sp. M259]|uniref:DUF3618 domain-containing protein n=1 Tax=Plantibacter sp. M259 TaxID=2583822 RepID=UPI001110F069|nr:DUF3618 domain-containing protein [Plantibacter sp. M259]